MQIYSSKAVYMYSSGLGVQNPMHVVVSLGVICLEAGLEAGVEAGLTEIA